jgi:hypothetical protein
MFGLFISIGLLYKQGSYRGIKRNEEKWEKINKKIK